MVRFGGGFKRFSRRKSKRRIAHTGQRFYLESLEPRHLLAAANLVISEFMAANSAALADGDGNFSDWIEIRNADTAPVDLSDYFLTDSADELQRWAFPTRTIQPGEHLVVFASSPPDGAGGTLSSYVDAGGHLHTNFSLDAAGEYLALTYEDPATHLVSIVHEYGPQFPPQQTDISYGTGQFGTEVSLVAPGATSQTLVPASGVYDALWSAPGYSPDANWTSGTTGVGFGQSYLGFSVRTYAANTAAGSPVGNTVDNIEEALEVIGNPTAQASVAAGNFGVVNFVNNTTTGGNYDSSNDFFPGLTGADANHFVTEVHALVTIPAAGTWTFGVASNEGFLLLVDDHEMERFGTGNNDQLATFNFTAPGEYELHLVNFERTGSTWLELFAAPGRFVSWNATSFDLVGDVANGGLAVRSDVVGSSGASISQLVGTNVQQQIFGQNSSFYTRIPFNADDPAAFEELTLRMKYDDAFVAYLNGVEVARRNFAGTPMWNSAADSPRTGNEVVTYEEIDISAHLPAITPGQNVLAIHGMNVSPIDVDLLVMPELAAKDVIASDRGFFTEPTPSAANGNGFAGFVADTKFSVDRGFFDAPFSVEIATATPGATIYYTTNGEVPTQAGGLLYAGPIDVRKTTTLRARAFLAGYLPTNVDTQTYLFPTDIVQQTRETTLAAGFPATWGSFAGIDYGLDPDIVNNPLYAATLMDDLRSIPTLSIVLDIDDMFGPQGIYSNSNQRGVAWERATSVEWITADGSPEFQVDAGIRIHGAFFRSNSNSRKHSFRLLFKNEYGPGKLDFPLFGAGAVDEFNTLVLRAGANDSYAWNAARFTEQFTRDQFARDLQRDAGHASPNGDFAHLYINGVYWGLYNPVERPDNEFAASHLGGDPENWDVIHRGGGSWEVQTGDRQAWDAMLAKAQQAGSSLAAYMELQGKQPNGSPNPAAPPLLDVVNYADYIALNVWAGNWDWPWNNYWAARNRDAATTTGFQFFNWDVENIMGNNRSRSDVDATVLDQDFTGADNAGQPHQYLLPNAEYRMLFADRVHKLMFNDGLLTTPRLIERYSELANEIERAMVAESARWGDMHHTTSPLTPADWRTERDWILNTYLPQRNAYVLDELKSYNLYPNVVAPVFNQHGGHVAPGFDLSITAPAGTIWYTLDGSDPRPFGGAGPSPSAIQYTGTPIEISNALTVKARVLAGGDWSALNEAPFVTTLPADATNLRITELHYHPANHPGVADDEDLEFFELVNIGKQPISLAGVEIAEFAGTPYTFADGIVLAAGERIIVARSPATFQAVYGTNFHLAPAGYAPANLSNGGERIVLRSAAGATIQDFVYSDTNPWPAAADGGGPSLEIIDPAGNSAAATNWRASAIPGGSPGHDGLALAGDFDRNGSVDADDRELWRATFGFTVPLGSGADGNGNAVIDAGDYVVWRNNLAASSATAADASAKQSGSISESSELSPAAHDAAVASFFAQLESTRAAARSFAPSRRSALFPQTAESNAPNRARLRLLELTLSIEQADLAPRAVTVTSGLHRAEPDDSDLLLASSPKSVGIHRNARQLRTSSQESARS